MEGYEIPIHRALTEEIMMAGVPRNLAIINTTMGAALGLGLHSWFAVPAFVVIHILAVYATKNDPQFLDCFRRHIQHKSYYAT